MRTAVLTLHLPYGCPKQKAAGHPDPEPSRAEADLSRQHERESRWVQITSVIAAAGSRAGAARHPPMGRER